MKRTQQLLDFLCGAFLVGGAPLSVFGLTVVVVKSCWRLFKVEPPDGVLIVVLIAMLILMLAAFLAAVLQRVRRRKGFPMLEVLLGITWASFVWGWLMAICFSRY
jgi:membrane-bound ClpP family serine protease